MLSGVELHLPRQMVVPALSTTQTEVCSRDTSSPTYCCCGFMIVLRFVRAEALMLQTLASAITGCPDLPLGGASRAAGGKTGRRPPAPPARSGLDGGEHGALLPQVGRSLSLPLNTVARRSSHAGIPGVG